LRDAQAFAGRPRKVTLYLVTVKDPQQAETVAADVNREFPEVHAALAGNFVESMPDIKNTNLFMGVLSFLTILVGGVGVLNTMLMAVHERTREIGVLRAVGWDRRRVLVMIMKESVLLGMLGGAAGIAFALFLARALDAIPMMAGMLSPRWQWDVFARAILVALTLGLIGGVYPAFRATRMQPVEALRYE
jgi:putative ABC transport system permease protein